MPELHTRGWSSVEIHLISYDTEKQVSEALAEKMSEYLINGGNAALAGGTSPLEAYWIFSTYRDIPWEKITMIPTDERCYPPGHAGRNDTFLRNAFGGKGCRIVSLETFFGNGRFPGNGKVEDLLPFDLTILGLGEDGHTASLFPAAPELGSIKYIASIHDSPKPPSERISLTLKALNHSRNIIFCVTGRRKRSALKLLLENNDIPAGMIRPSGKLIILADRSAFPYENKTDPGKPEIFRK